MNLLMALLKRIALSALAKMLLGGAVIYGLKDWLLGRWLDFRGLPTEIQVAFWVVLALVSIFGFVYYALQPENAGDPSSIPRYFVWYQSPLRRISWRFGPLLNTFESESTQLTVGNLPVKFRANWWRETRPKEAFLRSKVTGEKIELKIAGPRGYVSMDKVEACGAGKWIDCVAEFDPSIPAAQFLERFGPFELHFIYDGNHKFVRNFYSFELRAFFKRWAVFFQRNRNVAHPVQTI